MAPIPPPPALSKEEFKRRSFPSATMRDIDPAFCEWFEGTDPFYGFWCLVGWVCGPFGIRARNRGRKGLDESLKK